MDEITVDQGGAQVQDRPVQGGPGDRPVPRPRRADRPEWAGRTVDDPEGRDWHGAARRNWQAAAAVSPDAPIIAYEPVPLPDFRASVPAHVEREILGRFLQDRDSGIVHDLYAAVPGCEVDGIRNGTFFHFWSEVLEAPGEDVPCPLCIP